MGFRIRAEVYAVKNCNNGGRYGTGIHVQVFYDECKFRNSAGLILLRVRVETYHGGSCHNRS